MSCPVWRTAGPLRGTASLAGEWVFGNRDAKVRAIVVSADYGPENESPVNLREVGDAATSPQAAVDFCRVRPKLPFLAFGGPIRLAEPGMGESFVYAVFSRFS